MYYRAAALMEPITVLLEVQFDGEWRSMEVTMVVRGRPSKIEITNIVARSISTEVLWTQVSGGISNTIKSRGRNDNISWLIMLNTIECYKMQVIILSQNKSKQSSRFRRPHPPTATRTDINYVEDKIRPLEAAVEGRK